MYRHPFAHLSCHSMPCHGCHADDAATRTSCPCPCSAPASASLRRRRPPSSSSSSLGASASCRYRLMGSLLLLAGRRHPHITGTLARPRVCAPTRSSPRNRRCRCLPPARVPAGLLVPSQVAEGREWVDTDEDEDEDMEGWA